jgi:hypothetical protein
MAPQFCGYYCATSGTGMGMGGDGGAYGPLPNNGFKTQACSKTSDLLISSLSSSPIPLFWLPDNVDIQSVVFADVTVELSRPYEMIKEFEFVVVLQNVDLEMDVQLWDWSTRTQLSATLQDDQDQSFRSTSAKLLFYKAYQLGTAPRTLRFYVHGVPYTKKYSTDMAHGVQVVYRANKNATTTYQFPTNWSYNGPDILVSST